MTISCSWCVVVRPRGFFTTYGVAYSKHNRIVQTASAKTSIRLTLRWPTSTESLYKEKSRKPRWKRLLLAHSVDKNKKENRQTIEDQLFDDSSCTRSGNQELNPHATMIKHNTLITIFINVNLLHYIV